MLPCSPEPEPHPRKACKPPEERHVKPPHSPCSPVLTLTKVHARLRVFISVLLLHFVVIVLLLSSYLHLQHRFRVSDVDHCKEGRIFVYDVPSEFNTDLIDENIYSNNGFGEPAADAYSGVMPAYLSLSWYHTEQFALEVIFHKRMLNHVCRARSPENAAAFYVPFYAGLAVVDRLFQKNATAEELDHRCKGVLEWLDGQPYFRRHFGRKHFMVFGRITWDFRRSEQSSWGSNCIYRPAMQNVTRLLIERHPWDTSDVGVPYPTGFHPARQSELVAWQEFVRTKTRNALFSFAGAPRRAFKNDFRAVLFDHCKEGGKRCRAVDCSNGKCANGASAILDAFLDSNFCLQPRGDSLTRRSVFDCMIAGAVPVFFWRRTAYMQYEWFLPAETGSYSVFIHRSGVVNGTVSVREVLERIGEAEVRRMREKVVEIIPRIVYGTGGGVRDAVDVAVDGILKRFGEEDDRRRGNDLEA